MATVYKIEIKATSHWTNFKEETVEMEILKLLKDNTHLENIQIKAERL